MLSKAVCIQCSAKRWPELLVKAGGEPGVEEWDNKDEREWSEEKVITCPVKYCPKCHKGAVNHRGFARTGINDGVPRWCLYRFEQGVAAGMPSVNIDKNKAGGRE